MRFLCSENGVIIQNSLIKVILCDLKTLPIIQSGQDVCKSLVHDGSHLIVNLAYTAHGQFMPKKHACVFS
jgi:hypothetical protein